MEGLRLLWFTVEMGLRVELLPRYSVNSRRSFLACDCVFSGSQFFAVVAAAVFFAEVSCAVGAVLDGQ